MIQVRRATLEDKPALFKFIQAAYQNRWQYKIPERWQWEYVDNPFLNGTELPVWIAVDEEGNVLGQTCALVEPVKIGDEVYRLGWSVDTYLFPEYRGQGIGFQLQKANSDANEIFMSLSMSNANRRIKSGLGSVPIDPVAIYSRLMRYESESIRQAVIKRAGRKWARLGKLLEGVLHWTFLDRLAAYVLNVWLGIKNYREIPEVEPNISMEPVDLFKDEINQLWEEVSPHYYAIVKRDAKYLNWKYVQQPHITYLRFIARKNGKICGYLILRKGKPHERYLGIIADLFTTPDQKDVISSMVVFAVDFFRRQKVKDILVASTIPVYQSCFVELGFQKTKEVFQMFHAGQENPVFNLALESGSWFLGKGDHDWDQYPLAR